MNTQTQINIENTLSKSAAKQIILNWLEDQELSIAPMVQKIDTYRLSSQFSITHTSDEVAIIILRRVYEDKQKTDKREIVIAANRIGHDLDSEDAMQLGLELLVATRNIFFQVFKQSSLTDNRKYFEIKTTLSMDSDTKHRLERLQFLPPMLTIPKERTAVSGGYLTIPTLHTLNRHSATAQPFAAINKAQAVPFNLDLRYGTDKIDTHYAAQTYKWFESKQQFHFVYQYDFRGRLYCHGYDISHQGTEAKKAMLTFAETELLTPEGINYLKIEIANCFGQDKLSFLSRIKWFNAQTEFDTSKAKEPKLAEKALDAYLNRDKPTNINTYMDATASGLQLYAALTSCASTASLCNLNNSNRADVYELVADAISSDRQAVKKPLMTYLYGKMATTTVEEQVHEATAKLAPSAVTAMNLIYEAHKISKQAEYNWSLPDGFKVHQKDTKLVDKKCHIDQDVSITVSYQEKETAYVKNSRALAPNVIHSVDGYIVRRMITELPFRVTTIHDSFSCHPNNQRALKTKYTEILCDINESNLLQSILREITQDPSYIFTKRNTLTNTMIKASPYSLS